MLTINALIKDGATKKLAVNLANSNAGTPPPFLLTAASTYSGGLTLKNSAGGGTRLTINAAVSTVGTPGNITSSPFGRGPIIIGEAVTDKAGLYILTSANNTIANEFIVNTPLGTDQPYALRVDTTGINLSGKVTANSDLTIGVQGTSTGSITLTNQISGVGGVRLVTAGTALTVTLSGPNTYTGKTTVSAGILSFNSIGNVGGGASALGAPTTVANGTIDVSGTLTYTGSAMSSDRVINLLGNCTFYSSANGTLTLNGGFTGGANNLITFRGDVGAIVVNGPITHNGSLSRTDLGVVYLSNNANSFTGNVTISKGTFSVSSIANKDVNCALGAGKTITLGQSGYSNTGTLQFTGANGGSSDRDLFIQSNASALTGGVIENTVAGKTLTLSGNVTASLSGTVPQLWLTGAGNGLLSGIIGGNTGLVAVTKSGAGTWTLTGANTNRGPTIVNGGTLALSGANGGLTNSSAYTITSGAMLVLENTSAANNTNRLRDASAITLDNGTLSFTNNGGATASYYENAGALYVTNSGGTIVSAQAAVGMTNILSLGTLTRSGSATLNFMAAGLGESQRNRIFIAGQANGLMGLWATINTTNYAAYDSSLGVIVAGSGVSITNILAKGRSIIPDDPTLNAWINAEGTGGGITLAAAVTNRIKTLLQNTDWPAIVTMTNQTLLVNEVGVSAGNARALTLGTAVGEGAIAPLTAGGDLQLSASATNSVLTVNAAVSNNTIASSVTKLGLGTVVLAGTNIFTGPLTVNNGTLVLTGSNALTTAIVSVGAAGGNNAVMKLPTGSSISGTTNFIVGSIANGYGAVYLEGGRVIRTSLATEWAFSFGTATGGYGYFNMSAGDLSSPRLALGINGTVGMGIARLTSGTATFTEYITIGRTAGGTGVLTIDGATVNHANASANVSMGHDGGRAELNMLGGLFDNTARALAVRQAGGNPTGIVNLCSGTLVVDYIQNTSPGSTWV